MEEREVSTQEGSALARELGCDFVEASAKNCINVEKAFYDVVRQLRRQRQQSSRTDRRQTTGAYGQRSHSHRTEESYRTGRDRRGKEKKGCVIL